MRPDASERLAAVAPKKGPSKGIIAVLVLVVIALVVASVLLITSRGDSSASAGPGGVPKNGIAGGKGLTVYPGKAKSGVKTVDMYEDFQCSFCKGLEEKNGKALEKLAADGKIKLNYHVLSFLDDNIGNDSSKRAANAGFCAADQSKFLEFHNEIFANQPKEGVGYTDDQLKKFGKDAGISGEAYSKFTKCVDGNVYKNYVKATTDRMGPDKVTGTPAMKVNGKAVSQEDLSALMSGSKSPEQVVDKN